MPALTTPVVATSLRSAACIRRHPANPVLAERHVPFPSGLVFNAGVAWFQGRYVMVFRNDHRHPTERRLVGTNLGFAWSKDGVAWEVAKTPLPLSDPRAFQQAAGLTGPAYQGDEVRRVYDPRITVIGGVPHLCLAVDTWHGVRGAIVRMSDDFQTYEVLSLTTSDNRNMVLFPDRIGGRYVRLERPFPVYGRGGRDRFDIWCGSSSDLKDWGDHHLVMGVEHVPFANDKLGPAAPPVRTAKGWLTVFHAVDRDESRGKNGWENAWKKRYTAGICLLDLERPERVLGMSKQPLIAPEAPYEVEGGFRNQVIFPCGLAVEPDGTAKIWYGAADTVVALATCRVEELLALCTDPL